MSANDPKGIWAPQQPQRADWVDRSLEMSSRRYEGFRVSFNRPEAHQI